VSITANLLNRVCRGLKRDWVAPNFAYKLSTAGSAIPDQRPIFAVDGPPEIFLTVTNYYSALVPSSLPQHMALSLWLTM
jgi:hypothetical protein